MAHDPFEDINWDTGIADQVDTGFELDLNGPLRRLAHVYRFSSIQTTRKENVAEHSYFVTLYCLVLGRMINGIVERAGRSTSVPVDMEKLLTRAVVHDLDEGLTGDFIRTVKYYSEATKEALDTVAGVMMNEIETMTFEGIKQVWEDARDGSLEGDILAVVDLAVVSTYAVEEVNMGNHYMVKILREVSGYLREKIGLHPVLDWFIDTVTEDASEVLAGPLATPAHV